MAMSVLFILMLCAAIIYAFINGTTDAVSTALLQGAGDAIRLGLSMAGVLCLWCGVIEVMRQSGLMEKLSSLLRFPLTFLFPEAKKDDALRADLATAISANLLGLGNAATPLSIRACTRLHEIAGNRGVASDSACMLILLSSCSIQLIPATIAAARAGAGAANPFDILPAVWLTTLAGSAFAVISGVLLRHARRKHL